jgi:DNA-binding LacI/PurR family transcriptional regulator
LAKIDDVARLAKVSKGTVSNVFSQKRPTSPEVKERVLRVSKELNYVPNHIARSLVTKKTMTIGLTIPHGNFFFNSFHNQFINGVVLEASYYGYRVLLDMIPTHEVKTPFLASYPIDGAIVMEPAVEDERIELIQNGQIPIVTIGRVMNSKVALTPTVNNDNTKIMFDICNYLIDKGHREIMFLNASEPMTVSIDRKAGFITAMGDRGITLQSYMIAHKPELQSIDYINYGYDETMNVLGMQKRKVTAIIADDDRTAFSVMNALKDLDLHVPNDVSLFVICGDRFMMNQSEPSLTSMDLQPSVLAEQSVRLLMHKLGILTEDYPDHILVDSMIIERDSCASNG